MNSPYNRFELAEPIGYPWHEPETFQECMALMSDRESLPRTYEAWLTGAHHVQIKLKANGSRVVRVVLRPEDFLAWCTANRPGQPIDNTARVAYAQEMALRR